MDGRTTLILRIYLDSAGIVRYTLNKISYGKLKGDDEEDGAVSILREVAVGASHGT